MQDHHLMGWTRDSPPITPRRPAVGVRLVYGRIRKFRPSAEIQKKFEVRSNACSSH